MTERQLLVAKLVREGSLSDDERRRLDSFGWDSNLELVLLTREDASAMLDRYLSGSISADALVEWANAVEARDDVGFERGHEDALRGLIYAIANPEINEEMTPGSARQWLDRLA